MKKKDSMNIGESNPQYSGSCHLEVIVDKEMKDLGGFAGEVG